MGTKQFLVVAKTKQDRDVKILLRETEFSKNVSHLRLKRNMMDKPHTSDNKYIFWLISNLLSKTIWGRRQTVSLCTSVTLKTKYQKDLSLLLFNFYTFWNATEIQRW